MKTEFVLRVRLKDKMFNATDIVKQWCNAFNIIERNVYDYIEDYLPKEIRANVVEIEDDVVRLPIVLEPQLRMCIADYDFDLYDKMEYSYINYEFSPIALPDLTEGEIENNHGYKTYLMLDEACGAIKIGRAHDPKHREHTLGAQLPKIKLLAICDKDIEQQLHNEYKSKRMRGEWFNLTEKEVANIVKKNGFKWQEKYTPKPLLN